MTLGDGRRKRHIRDRSCGTETRSDRLNAAVPRAFGALIRNQLKRPDWLAGAGGFEPPNGGIKIRHFGPSEAARTTHKYEYPLFFIDLPRQAPTIVVSNS